MGFPKYKYWRGLPFPSPGDLPDTGIKPTSPALAGSFFTLTHQKMLCLNPGNTYVISKPKIFVVAVLYLGASLLHISKQGAGRF